MELWMKIAWAVILGAMLIFLIPRAGQMMRASRKASSREWMGVVLPLLAVVAFVILLILMVRG